MNKQWAINNLGTVATCDLLCILFCAFIHIAVLHLEGIAKCNLLCPIGSHLVSWSVIPGDKISFELRPHSHIDHSLLWHLSWVGRCTSPNFNHCLFKFQCPVNSPVTCLIWFLFNLSRSLSSFGRGFLKEIHSIFVSKWGVKEFLVFSVYLVTSWLT